MKNELYSKRMSAAAHFGWTVLSKAAKAYLVRQGITREMVEKMHEKSSYRIVARFRNANIGVSRVHKIFSILQKYLLNIKVTGLTISKSSSVLLAMVSDTWLFVRANAGTITTSMIP